MGGGCSENIKQRSFKLAIRKKLYEYDHFLLVLSVDIISKYILKLFKWLCNQCNSPYEPSKQTIALLSFFR